jgi:hypothetical protein
MTNLMLARVSVLMARVGESSFSRVCGKVGDVLDCVIPIALVIALAIGSALIAFGVGAH